ncbi:MAG: hypothetical protein AAGJ38_00865 [Planctomycetota bacterium]
MHIVSPWQRRGDAPQSGALGLAYQDGRWTLAAAPRDSEVRVWTASARGTSDNLTACWDTLTAGLPLTHQAWPLAVVLPAGRALHRRIDLPQADVATTARLVSVQTEGWLAGGDDTRCGWETRDPDDERPTGVTPWVVAAPRDVVDAALREAGSGPLSAIAAAVSDAAALMHGVATREGSSEAHELLILSGPTQCTLVLRRGVDLLGIDSVDAPSGASPEAGWHELWDAVETLAQESRLPMESLTTRWVGTNPAWATSPDQANTLPNLQIIAEPPADVLAMGAARALLERRAPLILSESYVGASAPRRVPVWAWAAALLALVVAAGLWVRSDLRAADALSQAEARHPELAQETQALRRQLNVLTYLESRPPTLLAILDEVTDKSNRFNPDTLRFSTDGGLEFSGVLRSADEIGSLVADLSRMRTLASAQLRSQKVQGREEVAYQITAQPHPRFFEAFVPPPRPDTESSASDEPGATSADPSGGET